MINLCCKSGRARGTIPKSMSNTAWWEVYSGVSEENKRDCVTYEGNKPISMQASAKILNRWEVGTTAEKYCTILTSTCIENWLY